ncbi:hypothetical protein V2O64_00275 [Verrucomicrobiaceae bacterium 227]
MKRILLLVIVLALLTGGYFVFRNQDKQQIGRQVDQLIENIEHKKISLRKPSDVKTSLEAILADEIEFFGAPPVPSGTHSPDDVIDKLATFHGFTTLCEIEEKSRDIEINGDEARVTIEAEVHVAIGKNLQKRENWTMMFQLKKSDVWRISGIKGTPPGNASSARDASDLF